jgi:hypothetical protein
MFGDRSGREPRRQFDRSAMSADHLLNVFVATGGHAFARDALDEMLRAVGVQPCFVDHPAAARLMNPDGLRGFDAVLLHDMPGMDFRAPVETRPEPIAPPPELVAGLAGLVEQGMGFVALHHALAGWPAWPAYAELLGGAFLYRSRVFGGELRPSSAYAPTARYLASIARSSNPVLDGIPARFEMVDELYCHELFEADIEPLLWRGPFDGRFSSAAHAVRRQPDPDEQRSVPASAIIGWATSALHSPVVSLQPGDGPETFAHPAYRRLIGNALHWVASAEARTWAKARGRASPFDNPLGPTAGRPSQIAH